MNVAINDPIGLKKKYYYSVKHHRFQDFRGDLVRVIRAAMDHWRCDKRKIKNPTHIESWDEVLDRYLWEHLFMRRDNVLHVEMFSFNELYGTDTDPHVPIESPRAEEPIDISPLDGVEVVGLL